MYLDIYAEKIKARGEFNLADYVLETVRKSGEKHLEKFDFISYGKGMTLDRCNERIMELLLGMVCHAADIGFPLFLLLTENRVAVYEQVFQNVKNDLEGFCVCGENDSRIFESNNLKQPAIVILKRNPHILKIWNAVFRSTGYLNGNPIIIIGNDTRKEMSLTNKYIKSIKNDASSCFRLWFSM